MKCKEFYFNGEENINIHVYKWEDDCVEPKGVVQISHGMCETAIRYEYFAKELTKNGYIVYINDHRGHGKTAKTLDNLGHLAEKDGFDCLVKDMNTLTNIIKKENTDLPLYLFGHSMGSFASQRYIMKYKDNLDGLILSGSNGDQGFKLDLAKVVTTFIVRKYNREYRSRLLDKLIFSGNNKLFRPSRTDFDWLSRDEKEVDKYVNDIYCGTLVTCGFFYDLICGLKTIEKKKNLKKIPLDLPIYIMSGDKDPVGLNGKGILRLMDRYTKLGVKYISCKLYNGGRHEMLHEINKDEVINDIITWLNQQNIYYNK